MEPFFLLGSFLPVAFILLIAAFVLAGRGEPDPTGRRGYVTYVFVVVFLSLATLLIVGTMLVSTLVSEPSSIGGDFAFPEPSGFDPDAQRTGMLLQALTIGAAAVAVLWFHALRGREVISGLRDQTDPAFRAYRTYLLAVCFVSIVTALFAGAIAIDALVRALAPGLTAMTSESEERDSAIRTLITAGSLTLATLLVFILHWRWRARAAAQPAPAANDTGPPEPPPVQV